MISECMECESKEFEIKEKDIVLPIGNPKIVTVKSECIVCKGCGNKYYNKDQMTKLSDKLKNVV